jgi:hypothetical protein
MDFTWGMGGLPSFTGLFDPGWWDRMRDTTTSGHFSPEATILTVGIFVVAGLFIALGLIISIRFRRGETAPSTWIIKPAQVRALLESALTQRSKMRVGFVRDDPGTRATDAAILSVDPVRGIELEMTTLVRANPSWVGKLVACDFRLRPDPRKEYHSFYAFVVPILGIAKAGDDFIHMLVGWPSRLELEQKRAFLRVEPPRGSIVGMELWHEAMVRGLRGNFGDPTSWGEPILRITTPGAASGSEIRNLSGGGLRLEIPAEATRHHQPQFEAGSRFLMRLVLAEPDGDPLVCFLALRLQNVYGDPETLGRKAYGLRFLSQGVPTDTPQKSLSWKTAAPGVPAIDDWVYQRHLEIYRSRGEA